MTIAQILKKIAYLEAVNQVLQEEMFQLDVMMRQLGFNDGLQTVKLTARAILDNNKNIKYEDNK
ncbi:MAG: hypothetical protein CK425_11705 [Parachlamydia sp.]|jgi:hypothetical protein|nr:MAG: hypothetical protein CK425_11705 [Parachlamydia sp.]